MSDAGHSKFGSFEDAFDEAIIGGKGDIRRKIHDEEWASHVPQWEKDSYEAWRKKEEQRQYPSYGMGFGPEGDGVELMDRAAAMRVTHQTISLDDVPMPNIEFEIENLPHKGVRIERVWCDGQLVYPAARPGSFEGIQWPQWAFDDKPDSNAKPALPALTRQAGEKYKGLGFNDGMDQ